ncbi:hypothetical protein NQD34_016820 [Periophthalmus magnuspinnatus]|nr:hypothetical protein NQD34_016820 [Periophthalmus magnuspinnatus]
MFSLIQRRPSSSRPRLHRKIRQVCSYLYKHCLLKAMDRNHRSNAHIYTQYCTARLNQAKGRTGEKGDRYLGQNLSLYKLGFMHCGILLFNPTLYIFIIRFNYPFYVIANQS